jgi:hypothetical protein
MGAELSGEWPPAKAFGETRPGTARFEGRGPYLEKLTVIGGIVFVTGFPSRSSPGV